MIYTRNKERVDRLLKVILITILCTFSARTSSQSRSVEPSPNIKPTVKEIVAPKDTIPFYTGMSIGTNLVGYAEHFWHPNIISPELSVSVSLKRKFFPTIEGGVADGAFTKSARFFKIKMQPYLRIGLDYRVIGTSDDNYFYVGLRYGVSPMQYYSEWTAERDVFVQYHDMYVGQWGEGVGGLKVRVSKHIAMGWNVRFRLLIEKESNPVPDYISGFGVMNENRNAISIQYSLYYRF